MAEEQINNESQNSPEESNNEKDKTIESLLDRIDLPGDKEIDRTPISFQSEDEENQEEDENTSHEELQELLKPSNNINNIKPPTLKTDKKRRITTNDLDNLYKDLDKTIAGEEISNNEPTFGEEVSKDETSFEEQIINTSEHKKGSLQNQDKVKKENNKNTQKQNEIDTNNIDELENKTEEIINNKQEADTEKENIEANALKELENISFEEETNVVIENDDNDQVENSINEIQNTLQNNLEEEIDKNTEHILDNNLKNIDQEIKDHNIQKPLNQEYEKVNFNTQELDTGEKNNLSDIDDYIENIETNYNTSRSSENQKENNKDANTKKEELSSDSILSSFTDNKDNIDNPVIENIPEFDSETNIKQEIKENIEEILISDTETVRINEKESQIENDIIVNDKTIKIIQSNIEKLPISLNQIVSQIIIEERLSQEPMQKLLKMIVYKDKPKKIQNFLENHFGFQINNDEATRYENKKHKTSTKLSKIAVSILILIFIASFLWISFINPYLKQENLYQEGLQSLRQGPNSYIDAINKINNIEGKSLNIKWLNKYIQELIYQNTPESLYFAQNLLLGKSKSNDKWLKEYQNIITNKNPGQEDINESLYKNLVLKKSILEENQSNPNTIINIATVFENKAYYADKIKSDPKSIDFYFNKALKKGYNILIEMDSENDYYWNLVAKTYINWGTIIASYNKSDMERHFKSAENIYKKLGSNNYVGLYGMLGLYLSKLDLTNQKLYPSQYKALENKISYIEKYINKLGFNKDKVDYKVLREYALYINVVKNNNAKAKAILHTIIQSGYFNPSAYYYLGRIYQEEKIIHKALELYIKALYSYYYNYIGREEFKSFIKETANPSGKEIETFNSETLRIILFIQKDSNIMHYETQSNIFLQIAKSYLRLSDSLRSKIQQEKLEKNKYIKAVKQNLTLSLNKNPNNIETLQILGDLAYKKAINFKIESIKTIEKNIINENSSIESIISKEYFKEAKSYYSKILQVKIGNKLIQGSSDILKNYLIQETQKHEIDTNILYKIAYIQYMYKNYNSTIRILHAFRAYPKYKFNPTLNFALGNAYLLSSKKDEAKRYFKNVIDVYETIISRYHLNPDPNNLKQNSIFSKLAATHNNIAVIYYLEYEAKKNISLKQKALYHYYKASEYASKLNNKVILQTERINRNILLRNITYLENDKIKLANRKIKDKKTSRKIPIKINQMIITYISPKLNKN